VRDTSLALGVVQQGLSSQLEPTPVAVNSQVAALEVERLQLGGPELKPKNQLYLFESDGSNLTLSDRFAHPLFWFWFDAPPVQVERVFPSAIRSAWAD